MSAAPKCAWPMGMTPKRNLVRRCGSPATHVSAVSKIALCPLHSFEDSIPLDEYLGDPQ